MADQHQAGPIILSAIILTSFTAVLVVVLTRSVPQGNERVSDLMLGTLAALACQVGSYWLGSSAGSARKDGQLADAQDALANSVPQSALEGIHAARRDGDHQ